MTDHDDPQARRSPTSDPDPSAPPSPAGPATAGLDSARVPSLIDQYRQRHRAWLAQATELVRLRDEVRSAAEREAVEIVTAARRDVRRVVLQARRELLALSEQLKAAEDAADQSMPPGLPPMGSPVGDTGASASEAARTNLLTHARRDVRSVLDEARAELDALSADVPGTGEPTAPPADEADLLEARPSRLDEPADLTTRLDALIIDGPVTGRSDGRGATDPVRGVVAPFPAARPIEPAPPASPWTNESTSTFNPFATARLERPWPHTPEIDDDGLGPLPTVAALTEQAPTDDDGRPIPVIEADVVDLSRPIDEEWFASPARPAQPVVAPADVDVPAEHAPEPPPSHVATPPAAPDALAPLETPSPDAPRASVDLDEPAPSLSGVFGSVDDTAEGTPSSVRRVIPIVGVGAAVLLAVGWLVLRGSREPAAPPEATRAVEQGPPAPAVADVAPVDDSLSLIIEARRQAWIRATIDGQEEAGRVYKAGETRQIVGARAVAIQAGDAGAVFVAVGDGPAEPLGANGAVATRRFSIQDPPPRAAESQSPGRPPVAAPAASQGAAGPGRPGGAVPVAAVRTTGPVAPVVAAPAAASPAPAPIRTADALAGGAGGSRTDLVAAGQQWLEAYHRRDREGMSVAGPDAVKISDERSVVERFPPSQTGVKRDLDQVELELTGDTAVLTGRLTERADGPSPPGAPFISRVSQIWVRRAGRWHLADVRIMGEGRLNQLVR